MSNNNVKNVDWMNELRAIVSNTKIGKKHILDEHAEYVLAMKKLGLSWSYVAERVNVILNLKGKQCMNNRSISALAKTWLEQEEIVKNADKIVAELQGNKQSDLEENKVHETASDTYQTFDEFTADVMKSPDQRFHNKEKIEQAFNLSKGRSKKEMLNALRDIVLKSMGNV
jgi:hypothetical protein